MKLADIWVGVEKKDNKHEHPLGETCSDCMSDFGFNNARIQLASQEVDEEKLEKAGWVKRTEDRGLEEIIKGYLDELGISLVCINMENPEKKLANAITSAGYVRKDKLTLDYYRIREVLFSLYPNSYGDDGECQLRDIGIGGFIDGNHIAQALKAKASDVIVEEK